MPSMPAAMAAVKATAVFSGWEALSFPAIANRLRFRVYQWLGLEPDPSLARERAALTGGTRASERLRTSQEVNRSIHNALLPHCSDPWLVEGLEALFQLYLEDGTREFEPILGLRRGLYLSPLELVGLDAHRHAFGPEDAPPVKPISGWGG